MSAGSAVLGIESATNTGSVAVGREGRVLAEVVSSLRSRHSTTLLPAIDQALRGAETSRSELGAVVVGAGPGSFTGVRIAAATAKGIAHALDIPLFAFSTLLCNAVPLLFDGRPVLVVLDARNRQVYAAAYQMAGGLTPVLEPSSFDLEELIGQCAGLGSMIVCGDGLHRHGREIGERLDAVAADPMLHHPRAASLVWLHDRFPDLGRVGDPAIWEPEYHRASGAERIRAAASSDP